MIRVVQLLGDSFDLETGKELPRRLVLTNGTSKFEIAVSDLEAAGVLELMIEADGKPDQVRFQDNVVASTFGPSNDEEEPTDSVDRIVKLAQDFSRTSNEELMGPDNMSLFVDDEEPAEQDFNEGDGCPEPGEEYTDSLTGVGSI